MAMIAPRPFRGCRSLALVRVFNAAQVDGYTPKVEPERPILEAQGVFWVAQASFVDREAATAAATVEGA